MSFLSAVWPYVAALIPTLGLLWLFYVLMKHIIEGDRRERAAQRAWEAEQDRAAGVDGKGSQDSQDESPGTSFREDSGR